MGETLVGSSFEQHQLIRDQKTREDGPGWLSRLKEALAPLRMHKEQEVPQIVQTILWAN